MSPSTRADELAALRRRAYGPDADIQNDPRAQARLAELERAIAPVEVAQPDASATDAVPRPAPVRPACALRGDAAPPERPLAQRGGRGRGRRIGHRGDRARRAGLRATQPTRARRPVPGARRAAAGHRFPPALPRSAAGVRLPATCLRLARRVRRPRPVERDRPSRTTVPCRECGGRGSRLRVHRADDRHDRGHPQPELMDAGSTRRGSDPERFHHPLRAERRRHRGVRGTSSPAADPSEGGG